MVSERQNNLLRLEIAKGGYILFSPVVNWHF